MPTVEELRAPLPKLQFDDGDVVLKLSKNPEGWLIVHSQVLASASPFFATWFKPEWSRTTNIVHPNTGVDVAMTIKALKFLVAEWTFALEGEVFQYGPKYHHGLIPFSRSDLADIDWPYVPSHSDEIRASYPVAIHILVAMLYGYRLTAATISKHNFQFSHGSRVRPEDRVEVFETCMNTLIDVCAYAQYYNCLPAVEAAVLKIIFDSKDLDFAIQQDPLRYVKLGAALRVKELYFSGVRHHLASRRVYHKDWARIAEDLYMDADDLKRMYEYGVVKQLRIVKNLENDLKVLTLATTFAEGNGRGREYDVKTDFLQAARLASEDDLPFTEEEKVVQRCEAYAEKVYADWFVSRSVGTRIRRVQSGKRREAQQVPFNGLCSIIQKAATWRFPAHVFGKDAARETVAFFNIPPNFDPETKIARVLEQLVYQANSAIDHRFPVKSELRPSGTTWTWRRCGEDSSTSGFFTYMPLDEADVPWADEEEWVKVQVPEVDRKRASKAWVELLGRTLVQKGDYGDGKDGVEGGSRGLEKGMDGTRRSVNYDTQPDVGWGQE